LKSSISPITLLTPICKLAAYIAANFAAVTVTAVKTISNIYPSNTVTDTVPCLYHQVMPGNKPAISWQSGYLVLEDKKLRLNQSLYPVKEAAVINGPIQNRFLKADKKTPVNKTVIQVIPY
jgi:hypothetical protein